MMEPGLGLGPFIVTEPFVFDDVGDTTRALTPPRYGHWVTGHRRSQSPTPTPHLIDNITRWKVTTPSRRPRTPSPPRSVSQPRSAFDSLRHKLDELQREVKAGSVYAESPHTPIPRETSTYGSTPARTPTASSPFTTPMTMPPDNESLGLRIDLLGSLNTLSRNTRSINQSRCS